MLKGLLSLWLQRCWSTFLLWLNDVEALSTLAQWRRGTLTLTWVMLEALFALTGVTFEAYFFTLAHRCSEVHFFTFGLVTLEALSYFDSNDVEAYFHSDWVMLEALSYFDWSDVEALSYFGLVDADALSTLASTEVGKHSLFTRLDVMLATFALTKRWVWGTFTFGLKVTLTLSLSTQWR